MKLLEEQIFYKIGEASKDGYFIYDVEQQQFQYINNVLFGILEKPIGSNFLPSSLLEIVHKDDLVEVGNIYNEVLETGSAGKYKFRIILNEQEKCLKASVNLVSISNKNLICGVIEDITKDTENRINIEQINARKNITLEVLSHDIKEPLSMINMMAMSMAADISDEDEKLQSSLSFIREMCERNLTLIRSMVNHEFLKSSNVHIRKERANLVWEIEDIIRFYRRSPLSQSKVFKLTYSAEKIYVYLDSMKFMQVINNLISNAIKFTKTGGTIALNLEDRPESVLISVSDDGVGIPQNIRPYVFEPGREGLRKGLKGEDSGGLGLGISKKIVELHEGKIYFVSEEGMGTTFYIELPKRFIS